MGNLVRNLVMTGAVLSAGAATGYMVEGRTNEVARGKITTIDTCLDTAPHETKVTDDLEGCFQDGVPGGNKIGGDKFDQGDPIEFVDAYRAALDNEASSVEANRLAIWAVAAPAGAIAVASWFM